MGVFRLRELHEWTTRGVGSRGNCQLVHKRYLCGMLTSRGVHRSMQPHTSYACINIWNHNIHSLEKETKSDRTQLSIIIVDSSKWVTANYYNELFWPSWYPPPTDFVPILSFMWTEVPHSSSLLCCHLLVIHNEIWLDGSCMVYHLQNQNW